MPDQGLELRGLTKRYGSFDVRPGEVFGFVGSNGAGKTTTMRIVLGVHQATPLQVMLARLLRRSPIMLPIPGSLSLEHVKANLGAPAIDLSDAEFGSLSG